MNRSIKTCHVCASSYWTDLEGMSLSCKFCGHVEFSNNSQAIALSSREAILDNKEQPVPYTVFFITVMLCVLLQNFQYLITEIPKSVVVGNTVVDQIALPKPKPAPKRIYRVYKTPSYILNEDISETKRKHYLKAIKLIKRHANSERFHRYVLERRKYFAHTDLSPAKSVRLFIAQLKREREIPVNFYSRDSKVIGGWDGTSIYENMKYNLSARALAGHLLHETAHTFGWIHEGNLVNKFDNENSFPYAIGYDFEDFLITNNF